MAIILAAIAAYVGSILFLRWRCTNTLSLRRQLTDFSTFMVPFNLPAYLLSKVPTTPRVDPSLFPGLTILEENWETIRDEALALYQHGHIAAKDDLPASSFYKDNRWKSFYLKLYDNNIPSARALAPKTLALIEQVPGMNMALFAVLMPGKKLNKHHDPFAYTLRYSLGLSTPNDERCGIFVDDADYTWRDGDAILFDETYLHHAYNNTETPRIILMTDVDRPLRSRLVQRIYFEFGRFFNRLFAVDNLDPAHSGIGNRLGQYLLAYKNALKRIKKRNRTLYVTGKWAVILGVLSLSACALI